MRKMMILVALMACISAAPAHAWRPLFTARALVNRAAAGGPVASAILTNRYPKAAEALANGRPGVAKALVWSRRHL